METISIRMAAPEDSSRILAVYAPFIRDTAITFEYEVPSEEEFRNRVTGILKSYPYLVAEAGGEIVGYAYASKNRERAAYQWNADLSVYIREDYQKRGIGFAFYQILEGILKWQGIENVYAAVTSPNPKSEAFHRKQGFEMVGRFDRTGYKFGKWWGVTWFQKSLGEYPDILKPVRGIAEFTEEEKNKLIQKAEKELNSR